MEIPPFIPPYFKGDRETPDFRFEAKHRWDLAVGIATPFLVSYSVDLVPPGRGGILYAASVACSEATLVFGGRG